MLRKKGYESSLVLCTRFEDGGRATHLSLLAVSDSSLSSSFYLTNVFILHIWDVIARCWGHRDG